MRKAFFYLRPARARDLASIDAMTAAESMPSVPNIDNITVATNKAGEVVGFIRLQLDDGVWHINPVVTYPTWRGYGVGKALVKDALKRTGELKLVARGPSVPFYEAMRFDKVDWDQVGPKIAGECDGCPMRGECNPQPMAKRTE